MLVTTHVRARDDLDEATLLKACYWCAILDLKLILLGLFLNDPSLLVALVGAAVRDRRPVRRTAR